MASEHKMPAWHLQLRYRHTRQLPLAKQVGLWQALGASRHVMGASKPERRLLSSQTS